MLPKIIPFLAPATVVGTYFLLRKYPLALDNPALNYLFKFSYQRKPEYALKMFKILLKMKIIQRNEKFNQYIISSGFDLNGEYLEQLCEVGFRGVEVGPISLNPSVQEQQKSHLGVKAALANICTYHASEKDKQFNVQLRIVPNFEVVKYTPYLLKENVLRSIESYCEIQSLTQERIMKKITIDFDHPDFALKDKDQPEVQKLIKQTQKQISDFIKDLEKIAKIDYQTPQVNYLTCQQLLSFLKGESQL